MYECILLCKRVSTYDNGRLYENSCVVIAICLLSHCNNIVLNNVVLKHTLTERMVLNGERFAALNFQGFNPTEVFAEILSRFLSQKYLLLMSSTYIHGKTFAVLLITTKTVKV